MKILLDECVDRRFTREFGDLYVRTVPQMGWAGVKNGSLMRLAEAEFDVFVTVDRNLSYQQDIPRYSIALIVIGSVSNRYADLKQFGGRVIVALESAGPGTVTLIS